MSTIDYEINGQKVQFSRKSVTINGKEFAYTKISAIKHSSAKHVYLFKYEGQWNKLFYKAEDEQVLKTLFTRISALNAKRAAAAKAKAEEAAAGAAKAAGASGEHHSATPTVAMAEAKAEIAQLKAEAAAKAAAAKAQAEAVERRYAEAAAKAEEEARAKVRAEEAARAEAQADADQHAADAAHALMGAEKAGAKTGATAHEDSAVVDAMTGAGAAAAAQGGTIEEQVDLFATHHSLDIKEALERAIRNDKKMDFDEPTESESADAVELTPENPSTEAFDNYVDEAADKFATSDASISESISNTLENGLSAESFSTDADAAIAAFAESAAEDEFDRAERKRKMKKALMIFAGVIVLFIILGVIYFFAVGTTNNPNIGPNSNETQQYEDIDGLIEDLQQE